MDAVGTTQLSPAQCLTRLRSTTWGRVAISMRAIAMVVPVPLVVLDDRVVFATTRGSTFDRAVQEQPVSIQTDGEETGPGDGHLLWSVVVSGVRTPREPRPPRAGSASQPPTTPQAAQVLRWNAIPLSVIQGWQAPMPHRTAASWYRDDADGELG
jgi:Pyridoxamine 5'-phosphate oxidase